jgi:hypothetical protein
MIFFGETLYALLVLLKTSSPGFGLSKLSEHLKNIADMDSDGDLDLDDLKLLCEAAIRFALSKEEPPYSGQSTSGLSEVSASDFPVVKPESPGLTEPS